MNWKIVIPMMAAVFAVGMAQMLGGRSDVDLNEPGVKDALNFAVVQHNKKSNAMYLSQVARVIRVQTQVVAGMKYIFTVEMARTPCRKNGAEQVCEVHTDPTLAQPYQCTFEVWSRPWLQDIQLTKHTCGI